MKTQPCLKHQAHSRRAWNDGTFSDAVTVRLPPEGLASAEMDQGERTVRLSGIVGLRSIMAEARGANELPMVAFGRLERDRAVSRIVPSDELVHRGVNPQPGPP